MQNALYVALSGQIAVEKRMNAVANNVANLATSGYRAEDTKFSALLAQASKGAIAFASSGDTYLQTKSGPVTKTDSPLDVAIQGDAWLSVGGASGPVYTRDGRLTMDARGACATSAACRSSTRAAARSSSIPSRDRRPSAAMAASRRGPIRSAPSACSPSTPRAPCGGRNRTAWLRAFRPGPSRISPAPAWSRASSRVRTSTRSSR